MTEKEIYQELKDLLVKSGYEIREDSMEAGQSGIFTLKDKRVLFLNKGQTLSERIEFMTGVLKKQDLSSLTMKPALRKLIGDKEWD
jgi:hypothetical protein